MPSNNNIFTRGVQGIQGVLTDPSIRARAGRLLGQAGSKFGLSGIGGGVGTLAERLQRAIEKASARRRAHGDDVDLTTCDLQVSRGRRSTRRGAT